MISQYFAPLKYAVRRVYNDIPDFLLPIPFNAIMPIVIGMAAVGFIGWLVVLHETAEIRNHHYDRIERYVDNCPGLVDLTKEALAGDGKISKSEYREMDDLMDECLDQELADHKERQRNEFIENINKM